MPEQTGGVPEQTGCVPEQTGCVPEQTGGVLEQTGCVPEQTDGSQAGHLAAVSVSVTALLRRDVSERSYSDRENRIYTPGGDCRAARRCLVMGAA